MEEIDRLDKLGERDILHEEERKYKKGMSGQFEIYSERGGS